MITAAELRGSVKVTLTGEKRAVCADPKTPLHPKARKSGKRAHCLIAKARAWIAGKTGITADRLAEGLDIPSGRASLCISRMADEGLLERDLKAKAPKPGAYVWRAV